MTSEKNKLNLEPTMSLAQVKIIAGTIVKRAFEKIGDIDNFVS